MTDISVTKPNIIQEWNSGSVCSFKTLAFSSYQKNNVSFVLNIFLWIRIIIIFIIFDYRIVQSFVRMNMSVCVGSGFIAFYECIMNLQKKNKKKVRDLDVRELRHCKFGESWFWLVFIIKKYKNLIWYIKLSK
jgi:hypothetical protein